MKEQKPRRGAAVRLTGEQRDITVGHMEVHGERPDGSKQVVFENDGVLDGLKVGTLIAPGAQVLKNTGRMSVPEFGTIDLSPKRAQLDIDRLRELLKEADARERQEVLDAAQRTRATDPNVVTRAREILKGAAEKFVVAIATREAGDMLHAWLHM